MDSPAVLRVCESNMTVAHSKTSQNIYTVLHESRVHCARRNTGVKTKAHSLMGPHSSTGSPMTFMMRPRVSRPTGTCATYQHSCHFAPLRLQHMIDGMPSRSARSVVHGQNRTRMGTPVLVTTWPRLRPSVCSIEMVRTVLSPMCCATSSTSRASKSGTSSAVVIGGKFPSKRTSTTAPMTCR